MHTRQNLCHFGRYVANAELFCLKRFVLYPGWSGHMGKFWSRLPRSRSQKTEISVTGPARLLIWTHRNFYEGKSGEARSRKTSQLGWLGSYEEVLSPSTTREAKEREPKIEVAFCQPQRTVSAITAKCPPPQVVAKAVNLPTPGGSFSFMRVFEPLCSPWLSLGGVSFHWLINN